MSTIIVKKGHLSVTLDLIRHYINSDITYLDGTMPPTTVPAAAVTMSKSQIQTITCITGNVLFTIEVMEVKSTHVVLVDVASRIKNASTMESMEEHVAPHDPLLLSCATTDRKRRIDTNNRDVALKPKIK
jgi:hypothetical protein